MNAVSAPTNQAVAAVIDQAIEQASAIGRGKFERFAKWAAGVGDLAAMLDQLTTDNSQLMTLISDPSEIELMSQALLAAELRGRLETQGKAESRNGGQRSAVSGQQENPPVSPLGKGGNEAVTQHSSLITHHSSLVLSAHAELFSALPFVQAIKALADRLGITKDKFNELDAAARSRAFTMAKIADEDVLNNIHDEIVATINDGETYAQFEKRMADVQDRTGWTGSDPWHYRLVYDQNLGMAYTAGRYQQGTENGLKAWRYLPSISDEPRPDHLPYYNKIYKADPNSPMPPWDFNCGCGWEWMLPDDAEMEGVDVEGLPTFDPPIPASGYQWQVGTYVAGSEKCEVRSENGTLIVCESINVASKSGRVLLIPWGEVKSTSGDFILDEQAAASIIGRFTAHGTDLPIDYEHQTIGGKNASPTGQAPAAGWIKSLEAEPGVGLFGMVEWTPPGADRIANREYRYLSPVVFVRLADRRAAILHSAGLTNTPAIAGMKPIVNSAALCGAEIVIHSKEKPTMATSLREKARQIASSPNLTPQDKVTQITALIDAEPVLTVHKDALSTLATELGEDGKGLATAIEAGDPGKLTESLKLVANKALHPTGVVPAAEYQALADQVKALTQRETERELDLLIQANSAKLPPAERDGFKMLYQKSPEFAKQWLASQPDRVLTRSVNTQGNAPTGNDEGEWQANSQLRAEFGDDKEAWLAYRKREQVGLITINGKTQ